HLAKNRVQTASSADLRSPILHRAEAASWGDGRAQAFEFVLDKAQVERKIVRDYYTAIEQWLDVLGVIFEWVLVAQRPVVPAVNLFGPLVAFLAGVEDKMMCLRLQPALPERCAIDFDHSECDDPVRAVE